MLAARAAARPVHYLEGRPTGGHSGWPEPVLAAAAAGRRSRAATLHNRWACSQTESNLWTGSTLKLGPA